MPDMPADGWPPVKVVGSPAEINHNGDSGGPPSRSWERPPSKNRWVQPKNLDIDGGVFYTSPVLILLEPGRKRIACVSGLSII
jgi:hypothetical protein